MREDRKGSQVEEGSGSRSCFALFGLHEQFFGIPVEYVEEVVTAASISWLSCGKKEVLGLMHLRGRMIPIVDLRLHLSFPDVPCAGSRIVMALRYQEESIGFPVDSVFGVQDADVEYLPSNFGNLREWKTNISSGIFVFGKCIVTVLDVEKIICSIGK